MNIQHMESIAPLVRSITGITVRETVPDWVVQSAAETVLVDLTPEALQNRMLRGDVYHPDKAGQALKNFFRRSNLIALRELALRQVAEQVDRSLEPYTQHEQKWMVRERIAVCVSSNPAAQYLIARGSRMARRLDAELYVVYVNTGKDEAADRQKSLAANLELATNLGARIERLSGNDVASAVAAFVREKHVTQVIFGRSAAKGWRRHLYMSAVHRFLRDAPTVDVHIVPQETD
jgi:two-component system sensor histidine kinase KdpD